MHKIDAGPHPAPLFVLTGAVVGVILWGDDLLRFYQSLSPRAAMSAAFLVAFALTVTVLVTLFWRPR